MLTILPTLPETSVSAAAKVARMAVGCYGIERKRVGDSTGPLSIA